MHESSFRIVEQQQVHSGQASTRLLLLPFQPRSFVQGIQLPSNLMPRECFLKAMTASSVRPGHSLTSAFVLDTSYNLT